MILISKARPINRTSSKLLLEIRVLEARTLYLRTMDGDTFDELLSFFRRNVLEYPFKERLIEEAESKGKYWKDEKRNGSQGDDTLRFAREWYETAKYLRLLYGHHKMI